MLSRTISKACLLLCLGWLGACDDSKPEAKGDPKAKAEVKKADEKKAEVKVEEKAEAKVEEKAEAKVEEKAEAKVDEKAEAKADEKADEKPDEKAEEKKAEEKKAEEKKAEEKKSGDKPSGTTGEKPDPGPSADGKGLYDKKCKNCHNGNGDGKTKIGEENEIEDWTVAGWKGKWTQAKIEEIVANGKSGTKMKPFKDKMTADEIVAVSKFARSLGK